MPSDAARRARTDELFEQIEKAATEAEREQLRNDIIVCNIPVADRLASRFSGRGIPTDDLRQVARLGLVKVVNRFRRERGSDFLSFAVPSIRGELRKYFRDAGWVVRPPRRLQEARQAVRNASELLGQQLGRPATFDELVEESELDPATVREVSSLDDCYRPTSLDAPTQVEGRDVADSVGEEDASFENSEARAVLAPMLNTLEPRDKKVIWLRFFRGLTQAEVGAEIGVSQMQVSRIQNRVIDQLQNLARPA